MYVVWTKDRRTHIAGGPGFACTREELPQELATRVGVKLADVVDYGIVSEGLAREPEAIIRACFPHPWNRTD